MHSDFPNFPSRASPCDITFQLDSTIAYVHSDFPNALCYVLRVSVRTILFDPCFVQKQPFAEILRTFGQASVASLVAELWQEVSRDSKRNCWPSSVTTMAVNNNNNNNNFTAIWLLPGGSGYFTCIQNMKLVTTKFKSGGLHEKHVVATWNVGNHLSICL